MTGFIPKETINNILDAVNIRQVIEGYVPLKKSGRNWVGLCPFHPDKDPSFSVNEEKQIFHCFGCSQGGNVFTFLMKIDGLSFAEAAKRLADSYGINIPERPTSPGEATFRAERNELVNLNREAALFYHDFLTNSRNSLKAMEYLKKRGLSEEIIVRFQLGWAPNRWDSLLNYFKSRGVALEVAEKAGLLVKRNDNSGYYDRFRSRIIFPIHDPSGKIVALGGRIIGDGLPKYLNSPESPVYQKGKILYGLYLNKAAIRSAGKGFVVEGYMDLLALYQFGIYPVVATLGTALTDQHVRQMRGLARDWHLVFDGDNAGLKASMRSLPLFFKAGLYPKVVVLPEGDDPDSFVRQEGKDAWDALSGSAKSGIDFVIDMGRGDGPEEKMRVIDNIISFLEPIQDPVKKSLFAGHAAHKLGIREDALWERLKSTPSLSINKNEGRQKPEKRAAHKAEEKVVGFILSHPQYIPVFLECGMDFWLETKELKDIWVSVTHVFEISNNAGANGPSPLLSLLFKHLEPAQDVMDLAKRLLAEFPPCDDPEKMSHSLLRYCEERRKKALRQDILQKLRSEDDLDDKDTLLISFKELR